MTLSNDSVKLDVGHLVVRNHSN